MERNLYTNVTRAKIKNSIWCLAKGDNMFPNFFATAFWMSEDSTLTKEQREDATCSSNSGTEKVKPN